MLKKRSVMTLAATAFASLVGVLGMAPAASASVWVTSTTVNNCDTECIVLHYNRNYGGSRITLNTDGNEQGFYNLGPYTFQTSGAGQGLSVKNRAASAQARHWGANWNATIYFSSGYAGPCDKLLGGPTADTEITYVPLLDKTYNNNASVYWRNYNVTQGCTVWR